MQKVSWTIALSLIVILHVASPVIACESYEECMNPKLAECKKYIGYSKNMDGKIHSNYIYFPCDQPNHIRALAYKLDEISKKLSPNPDYKWVYRWKDEDETD